jgi:hypothetical protein
VSPDEIDGLVAWYTVDSLRRDFGESEGYSSWSDLSGNEHHLSKAGKAKPSIFQSEEIGGRPTVRVGGGAAYGVAEPFDLSDHTIFLAYRAHASERALFRSDSAEHLGIVLHEKDSEHVYRTGGVGSPAVPYNKAPASRDAFGITVLGRDSGNLRSFINGIEVSSGAKLSASIRVGQFFHIIYSTMVSRDAEGLQIGEMVFYDRFLTRTERDEVVEYLATKFGVTLGDEVPLKERLEDPAWVKGAALARLETAYAADLNVPTGSFVTWNRSSRLDPPFRHDPEENSSRLYCTRDGTRLRVYLSLPLEAEQPETRIRVLLMKNDSDFHDEEIASVAFGGEGDERKTTVELEATLLLDAGEFIEVVTFQYGAEGKATLANEGVVFVVEAQ